MSQPRCSETRLDANWLAFPTLRPPHRGLLKRSATTLGPRMPPCRPRTGWRFLYLRALSGSGRPPGLHQSSWYLTYRHTRQQFRRIWQILLHLMQSRRRHTIAFGMRAAYSATSGIPQKSLESACSIATNSSISTQPGMETSGIFRVHLTGGHYPISAPSCCAKNEVALGTAGNSIS